MDQSKAILDLLLLVLQVIQVGKGAGGRLKIIILGGLTQVLQKLMMVVRPKAASKVFKFAILS